MGEKMTLEQVRDAMLEEKAWARGIGWPMAAHKLQKWADALTAHLTLPAQAVDVGAMLDFAVSRAEKVVGARGVVFELRFEPMANQGNLRDYLTAALPNANGKDG